MAEWWNSMIVFERVMFTIAAVASVVLIVQLILLFVGMGASDADVDFDTDGEVDGAQLFNLKLFSIRGIFGFLAVGGWVALLCSSLGLEIWASALIGVAAGLVTAILIALFYKWMEHMENDGNIDIRSAVGKNGTVYIPVPGKGKGKGKVTVTMEDRIVEYDAVTEEPETISTNASVEVTAVRDETTIVVRTL